MNMPPWSHSSLTRFETCPRQYYHTKVAKDVTEAPTEATRWGNTVHKALELRVRDKTPLPEAMQQWEPHCARLDTARGRVYTEQRVALDRNLHTCKWYGPGCWVVAIADVFIDAGPKAVLLDWKTGKPKEDSGQLALSAAMFMHERPYIEEIFNGYVWLGHGTLTPQKVARAQLPAIWEGLCARVDRLEAAYRGERWLPKPSGLCKGWCPVGRKCEFWSPKQTKGGS